MVSRPRPAVPPVMKMTLPAKEGTVVVSKVVDMVEVECGGLMRGWIVDCGRGVDAHSKTMLLKMRSTGLKCGNLLSILSRSTRRLEFLYTCRSQARIGFSGGTHVSSSKYDDGLRKQKTPLCKYTSLRTVRSVLGDEDYDIRPDRRRRRVGTT